MNYTANSKRIRWTASAAASLAILMMTSSSLLAATAVTSAQPSQLAVKQGQSATVFLRGTDLDQVSRVLVYENRRMSRDLTASFSGAASRSGRRLVITARPGARLGNSYQLVLLGSGNRPVPVSTSTVRLAVIGSGPALSGLTASPAVARSNASRPVAGNTDSARVVKLRPGEEAIRAGEDVAVVGRDGKAMKEMLDGQPMVDRVAVDGRFVDLPDAGLAQPGSYDDRFSNNTVPGAGNGMPEGWANTNTGGGNSADRDPRNATEFNPFERDPSNGLGGVALPNMGEVTQFDDPTQHGMGSTATGEHIGVGGQRYGSKEDAMLDRIKARKGQLSDEEADTEAVADTGDSSGTEEQSTTDRVVEFVKNAASSIASSLMGTVGGTALGIGTAGIDPAGDMDQNVENKSNEFEGLLTFRRLATGECSYGMGGKEGCKQIEGGAEDRTPNPMDDYNGTNVAGGSNIRVTPGCVNAECTEESMIGRAQVTESQAYAAGRARLNTLINPGDHGGPVAVSVSSAPAVPRPQGCINAECVDPGLR